MLFSVTEPSGRRYFLNLNRIITLADDQSGKGGGVIRYDNETEVVRFVCQEDYVGISSYIFRGERFGIHVVSKEVTQKA